MDDCPPELELEALWSRQRLEAALEEASAVLLLPLRDERPCQEIAQQLGLTDRQVKRHLARGYEHLRARLEG